MTRELICADFFVLSGDWGKYQFRQHVYHILAAFLAGLHMLSLTMVAPTPNHRLVCYDEDVILCANLSW